jgi:hypothetical protein
MQDLLWPFDFDVQSVPPAAWVHVEGHQVEPVATDGTGALFALLYPPPGPSAAVLYASSEGQAGVLARGLAEGLALLVWLPYWRELLKFSGGGQLAEMRRVEPYLIRDLAEDEGDIAPVQQRLAQLLQLTRPEDPVGLLHRRVAEGASEFRLLSDAGEEFESLFNRFVLEDNPMWRSASRS